MRLDAKKYLEDVRLAAELILQFTAGKSFLDYDSDPLLRSGVDRQFQIIGDAVNRLSKVDQTITELLPATPRIVAFRNILVHAYDVIDNEVVWDVIQDNLIPLHTQVTRLLSADD
jgi:uncharacterized protein with HEPN domain